MSKLKAFLDRVAATADRLNEDARGNRTTAKRAMLGRFAGSNRAARRAEEFKRLVAGGNPQPHLVKPGRRHPVTMRHRQRRAAARSSRQAHR